MYSESDLDGAVEAGAISVEAARSFRAHVAAVRETPSADDESFRLITGFNDIFVSIALILTLGAVGGLGWTLFAPSGGPRSDSFWIWGLAPILSPAAVAAASWMLAEFFTRRRRMALPSILLLLSFVVGAGVAASVVASTVLDRPDGTTSDGREAAVAAVGCAAAALAAWLHWRRFTVPITVAAGAAAAVGLLASLVLSIPGMGAFWLPVQLLGGLALFALAMRWDLSDPQRRTRRADVAFWLHLAAAPMIAHPLFGMLGVLNGGEGLGAALAVLALYLAFAAVALAVDRRALLVSGLVYVIAATGTLIQGAGAVDLGWIVTALVIGSALLSLSAFWQSMRRVVLDQLGDLGRRLPPAVQPA